MADTRGWSVGELMLGGTLQGLANRTRPTIWFRGGDMYARVEQELKADGTSLHVIASPWGLLSQFSRLAKGYVLFRAGGPSVSAATSLCGILDGVAVEEKDEGRARAAGLALLADARTETDEKVFARYGDRFARGVAVEQDNSKMGNLRDFAVAHRAFTFWTEDSAFRTRVVKSLGPDTLVWGWGRDEMGWITDVSRGGGTGVPADWCSNVSALEKLPAGPIARPRRPAITAKPGTRVVAFVMSDGDNVQWMCGNFVENASFWASPLRGTFPMTWEVSPLLAAYAPRVLARIYSTASPTDGIVSGAGGPGYTYPHVQPDRVRLAAATGSALRASDLSVVSVLNLNDGNMGESVPMLRLPGVEGAIYKDYAPYNRSGGAIVWSGGKPSISYRFLLWEGRVGPDQLAAAVAKMPADAPDSEASYALVQVHAWSFSKVGGPLEAVRQAIAAFGPETQVVTADQLIRLMVRQFGPKHVER